jgi:hypothetical protein
MFSDYTCCDQTSGPGRIQHTALSNPSFLLVLVVMLGLLVYCLPVSAASRLQGEPLPPQVAEMRDLILSAARSGQIDDLKAALDLNGVQPDFGAAEGVDQIAALKRSSGDGKGIEILAALGEILDLPPAAIPLGKDLENNLVYVWPYLAEKPLESLSDAEEVDLYRLVAITKAKEMREKKRWTWWRLTISADGTWQTFKKED